MRKTKEQIEAMAKVVRPRKKAIGRPPRAEPTEQLSVHMPVSVVEPMREKLRRTRDTMSNYLTRLTEKDLREGEK